MDVGEKFIATCDLMGEDKNQVLENLMVDFVADAQSSIATIAELNPMFASQYPFIKYPDGQSK